MKLHTLVGAAVLALGLCSQSFGAGLLDRMLAGSCCNKSCCEAVAPTSCCENSCAAAANAGCCEQACAADPGCAAANSCCDTGCCKKQRCRIDLFAGLRGLFHRHSCCNSGCNTGCCDNSCAADAGCAAANAGCCEKACAADPGCAAANSCCDTGCCKKKRCGLLANLFKRRHSCCNTGCDSCSNGCTENSCAAAANTCCEPACGVAPVSGGRSAPIPPAPMADPSAQGRRTLNTYVHAR